MTMITREQLKEYIDNKRDFTLIDALPPESYRKGHIPNAMSMPTEQIEEFAVTRLKDKNQLIITYCANDKCPKSRQAADKLKSMGYTNVSEFTGGIEDWLQGDFPLATTAVGEEAYGSGEVNKKLAS
jgi:rhodanese-related sulfurtransferase